MLVSACATTRAAPAPTPEPDVPTWTTVQVWSELRWHVMYLRHSQDHYADLGCALAETVYVGHGYWRCADWLLNERTGNILRGDGTVSGHTH